MMPALTMAAWFLAGVASGAAYFTSIWWSARQVAAGGRATMTVLLSVLRLAVLGGVLMLASLQGAGPLLAMGFGVVTARFGVMRRLRQATP